jgi:3-hydroxybutyryl-CoA dehydrogenase
LNTDSGEKNLADSKAPIRTIGVLGAGTMGNGIAQVAAVAGFEVILRDLDEASLQRGKQAIERNLAKGVQLGKVTAELSEQALARIKAATKLPIAVGR